ncbi:MAG TPA: hypothetical protein RMG48_15980 [Myxococcales bacterium LLY-WYZ-16_1]|nr:hypothetical protein [Myxococcales bacterium LLY-WYZ-16_1]
MMAKTRTLLLSFLLAGLAMTAASPAFGQAWVGETNSLSLGVQYTLAPSNEIVEEEGLSIGNTDLLAQIVTLSADYVTPIPRLAVRLQLPLVIVEYQGTDTPGLERHGSLDDGSLHLVPTDLRLDVRYGVLVDPFALAVNLGGSLPTHDYETQGFAAPGRGIAKFHLGASVGRTLEPLLDELFFQVGYELTLGENFSTSAPETSEISQHYSDVSATIGYFILPQLPVTVDFDYHVQHDGIRFLEFGDLSSPLQDFHDALLLEEVVLFGGSLSYFFGERLAVTGFGRAFVGGANTRNQYILGANFDIRVF